MFYRDRPLANHYDVRAPGHIQKRSERCPKINNFSGFANFNPFVVGVPTLEASRSTDDPALWFSYFTYVLVVGIRQIMVST